MFEMPCTFCNLQLEIFANNLLLKSHFVKYLAPFNLDKSSSKVGIGSASKTVMLLSFLKSIHNLIVLSFFITTVIGEAYGDDDRLMIPEASMLSTSVSTASVACTGSGYCLILNGVSSTTRILCSIHRVLPGKSLKVSENPCSKSVTSFC